MLSLEFDENTSLPPYLPASSIASKIFQTRPATRGAGARGTAIIARLSADKEFRDWVDFPEREPLWLAAYVMSWIVVDDVDVVIEERPYH